MWKYGKYDQKIEEGMMASLETDLGTKKMLQEKF
jgi:hypothetical protein